MTREDPSMKSRTFREIYGEREGITAMELNHRLFRLTLYPHARPFVWLLRRLHPRHFVADYEFTEDVGHLRSLEDYTLALGSYLEHPSNHGFLRRRLRIRVSARRMFRIVRSVFPPRGPAASPALSDRNTFEPFDGPPRTS